MIQQFICIVAGENPEEILKRYDNRRKVEPYLVYKFDRIEEYREQKIRMYYEILNDKSLDDNMKALILESIENVRDMSDIDFYADMTANCEIDSETGDAYSTLNLEGHFDGYRLGNYAMPLKDKGGNESYSMIKKDIDFSQIHLNNQHSYEVAWDLAMEGKEPVDDEEKALYERIKTWTNYFNGFGDRKTYVASSTAFWGHAFTDGNNWYEFDGIDRYKWVSNFYDRFIKPLTEDTKITIFECSRCV